MEKTCRPLLESELGRISPYSKKFHWARGYNKGLRWGSPCYCLHSLDICVVPRGGGSFYSEEAHAYQR